MTLKELIDSEPLNAGRTDQQVLDWLKESVTVETEINYIDFVVWASQNQIFKKTADEIAAATATAGVMNDLFAVDAMLKSGGNWSLDLSRQDVRSIFNNLSGSGKPYSAPNRTALFALSDTSVERWTQQSEHTTEEDNSRLAFIARARAA